MASLPQCRSLEYVKQFNITATDLAVVVASFLAFVGAFHLNQYLDRYMLYAPGVSLIFIPAGVKLLAILIGRLPAIVGLYIASVYVSTEIWHDLQTASLYLFAAVSVFSYAIAVYVVMILVGIFRNLNNLRYHHIVVLSFSASMFNSVVHNAAFLVVGVTAVDAQWATSTAMAFGDFLGCLAVVSFFHAVALMFKKVS
ncbi:hypothetical protein [Limnohabitans sp. INBF002]|jgi:hypothetical protein|uniref:hypothetical protein n=1 Tax=Limnohabitans sp. INBF002 TaxID=2986280 RepID=UPI0023773A05|nr:hypothetical protein [Limnohabitans sp. INBF002]BDU51843.1 hypothetical protein LINBF2_00780 [Limnohabitans sp. INBF002]